MIIKHIGYSLACVITIGGQPHWKIYQRYQTSNILGLNLIVQEILSD
jgi:hypothetical protein